MGFDSNGSAQESLDDIAVVGMACRLPGADDLGAFEDLLWRGGTGRRHLSEENLRASGVSADIFRRGNYVPVCYPIAEFDTFDADFFGYSAEAAAILDPQQRIFLETAYHAIEDAGLRTWDQSANVGVFAGGNLSTYLLFNLMQGFNPAKPSQALEMLLSNDKDYLASRLAYKLDLRGPSITVQTACSSSLVAICQASASLLNYECDAAIAGGVAVRTPHLTGYVHEAGGVMSRDGLCYSFDSRATGTVFGNGAGAVVLKRLADAITDGDRIHAVVKGFAVNNDGAAKAGFSAPNVEGQARVVSMALRASGVGPERIGYIEAHGTGTTMGDPIEVAALGRVFSKTSTTPRLIGSVKSNIGHCDSAAGVAGFIKSVIAVREGRVMPAVNFEQPNPKLDLERAGLAVTTTIAEWPMPGHRFAGVSSFGMGGVNAHVVLSEPPTSPSASAISRPYALVACSARSSGALEMLANATADRLSTLTTGAFGAFADASIDRRASFEHRLAVVADTPRAAAERLRSAKPRPLADRATRPCLVFSGQGQFAPGDGADLFAEQVVFRKGVGAVLDAIGDAEARAGVEAVFARPEASATDAWWTPVAAFALQHGLASHWRAQGLEPAGVIGHSAGEYAAATTAGVLDLEAAVEGLTLRSRQMSQMCAPGGMAALQCSHEQVESLIAASGEQVEIAAVNGPRAVTVTGGLAALENFERFVASRGERLERLAIPHACHSSLVEPMVAPLLAWFERQSLAQPRITMYPTAQGAVEDVATPAYWVQQLRNPVLFDAAVARAEGEGCDLFLEIGAGAALTVLGKMRRRGTSSHWVTSLPPRRSGPKGLAEAASELWMAGALPRLPASETSRHAPLPSYPFQRVRYWRDAMATPDSSPTRIVLDAAARLPGSLGPERLSALQTELTSFSLGAMQSALQTLADGKTEWRDTDDMISAAGVVEEHRSLVRRWVDRLDAAGRLTRGPTVRLAAPMSPGDWDALRDRTLDLLATDNAYAQYLADCAENLVPVVRGQVPALETLFPRGRFDVVDALYRSSPVATYFNDIARAAARAIADGTGRTNLSIIEIGAGTGGFTSALAPALAPVTKDYWFTDLSDFFFRRARREFSELPVRFRTHDIARSAAENGVQPGSFDIVAASNVLHATPDLEQAVRHAVELLAPGGWLIINELVRNEPWLEVTVGLVEGWRLYSDAWRKDGPLVPVARWLQLLDLCGLEEITVAPGVEGAAALLGQQIILACKPGSGTARAWSAVEARPPAVAEPTMRFGELRAQLVATPSAARRDRLEQALREGLASRLGLEHLPIEMEQAGFFEMGIDSLKVVEFAASLSDSLDLEVPSAVFFDFPTIRELSGEVLHLLGLGEAPGTQASLDDDELMRQLETRLEGHV